MSKRKKVKLDKSSTRGGDLLFEALTSQEIAKHLDALFEVLPHEVRDKVLDLLQPDTRQTVQHTLSPPKASSGTKTTQTKPVSMAKLEQTWSQLWDEWYGAIEEAAQEDGAYIEQEAHWEPSYFDGDTFIEDLKQVAGKMRPLLQTAFQNGFSPDAGFAQALLDQWRVGHKRRRNLWQALEKIGLGSWIQ